MPPASPPPASPAPATPPAFDGNAYRKDVLKGLLHATELPDDPFLLVGLPPDADDTEAIRAHLDRVVGFWRKEQTSPRYGALATTLLGRRDALTVTLLDPAARAAARSRTDAQAGAVAEARVARLDEVIDQLVDRFGGVPASRVPRLHEVFGDELPAAVIAARLAGRRVIEDAAEAGPTLPDAVRRRVRSLLVELTRLRRQADPRARPLRTLHDLLDVDPGAPPDQIEARRAAIEQRTRQRRHDRERTVTDELLALTTQLLVRGDPAAYAAAVAADAMQALAPAVETTLLLDDRLSAPEFERLLREAVELGLDAEQARQTVITLASRAGAPIETGAVLDYVTCTRCGAAQPLRPDHRTCSRCSESLYRPCPRCGVEYAASVHSCPACGFDVAGLAGARADLAQAVRAAEDGRADDARGLLEGAEAWAGHLPELAGVRERLRDAEAAAALAGLGDLEGGARETAVIGLLARHPGAPALLTVLREIGVAPATDLRATPTEAGLAVTWQGSASPGAIAYRVQREVRPFGAAPQRTSLGRTGMHEVEDAGAPAGVEVAYVITAVREGIAAADATSAPVVLAPDVTALRAVQRDGAVELVWTTPAGAADVWVEVARADDPTTRLRRIRGGTSGVLDTAVNDRVTYRYTAVAEYRPAVGPTVRSHGRSVEVQAVSLPDPPRLAVRTTADRVLLDGWVEIEADGVRLVVARTTTAPRVPAGRVGETPTGAGGAALLTPRRGVVSDQVDGAPRWYQPWAVVGGAAVAGHVIAHPGLGPVTDVTVVQEGTGARVTWRWPQGCTECRVLRGSEPPPDGDAEPGAGGLEVRKVTNSRYEIDGGAVLPDLPPGTHHLLVVPLARAGGTHVALPQPGEGCRATHVQQVSTSVSYVVRRVGKMRRSIRIDVDAQGPLPPGGLLVVASEGSATQGQVASAEGMDVLGTVGQGQREVTVEVGRRALPLVVSLVAAPDHPTPGLSITHPDAEARTLR